MLKLYKFSEDSWFVLARDYKVPTDGPYSLNIAIRVLHECCGVDFADIEDALLTLNRYDHNAADFGVNKMLTFTDIVDISNTYVN